MSEIFYVLRTKIDSRYKLIDLFEAKITWANYSGIRASEFFYNEFYTGTAQAVIGLFVEGIFLLQEKQNQFSGTCLEYMVYDNKSPPIDREAFSRMYYEFRLP